MSCFSTSTFACFWYCTGILWHPQRLAPDIARSQVSQVFRGWGSVVDFLSDGIDRRCFSTEGTLCSGIPPPIYVDNNLFHVMAIFSYPFSLTSPPWISQQSSIVNSHITGSMTLVDTCKSIHYSSLSQQLCPYCLLLPRQPSRPFQWPSPWYQMALPLVPPCHPCPFQWPSPWFHHATLVPFNGLPLGSTMPPLSLSMAFPLVHHATLVPFNGLPLGSTMPPLSLSMAFPLVPPCHPLSLSMAFPLVPPCHPCPFQWSSPWYHHATPVPFNGLPLGTIPVPFNGLPLGTTMPPLSLSMAFPLVPPCHPCPFQWPSPWFHHATPVPFNGLPLGTTMPPLSLSMALPLVPPTTLSLSMAFPLVPPCHPCPIQWPSPWYHHATPVPFNGLPLGTTMPPLSLSMAFPLVPSLSLSMAFPLVPPCHPCPFQWPSPWYHHATPVPFNGPPLGSTIPPLSLSMAFPLVPPCHPCPFQWPSPWYHHATPIPFNGLPLGTTMPPLSLSMAFSLVPPCHSRPFQ